MSEDTRTWPVIDTSIPIKKRATDVDKSSNNIINLKVFIQEHFLAYSNMLFFIACTYKERIISTKTICLNVYLNEEEMQKFIAYNSKRVFKKDELYFVEQRFVNSIIAYLSEYMVETPASKTEKHVNIKKFDDVEEDDNLRIQPMPTYTFRSFLQNMFVDNSIEYVYTNRLPWCSDTYEGKTKNSILTGKIKVTGTGDIILYPVRYELQCRHKDNKSNNKICGRVVHISELDMHSSITCIHNYPSHSITPELTKTAHTLKNLSTAKPDRYRFLYSATGHIYDNKNNCVHKDVMLFSLLPFTHNVFETNFVLNTSDTKTTSFILLNKYVNKNEKKLKNSILLFDRKVKGSEGTQCWIDDIFHSIQTYYKQVHNINITDQNKMVGLITTFCGVCNLYFNEMFHAFILGLSGSGKTFHAKHILPLLTVNHIYSSGLNVTRNAFIGGKSNMKSSFQNSMFSAGFVATQNVVVLDEASDVLDLYHNDVQQQNKNNIFAMMKLLDGKINIGIQGSQDIYPKASIILFGNVEQLHYLKEYKRELYKQYKKFSDGTGQINNRLPLYHPIEYYIHEKKNEALAKAHYYARYHSSYNSSLYTNFLTRLPEAEMARYTFFMVLENEQQGVYDIDKPTITNGDVLEQVHTLELQEELQLVFKDKDMYLPKYELLHDKIHEWFVEYMRGRNNFLLEEGMRLNAHVNRNLHRMLYCIVFGQRWYWNIDENSEEFWELSEEDKWYMQRFLVYNYNTVTTQVASLKKLPYHNDYSLLSEKNIEQEEVELSALYRQKMMNEQKMDDIVIDDEPLSDLANDILKDMKE